MQKLVLCLAPQEFAKDPSTTSTPSELSHGSKENRALATAEAAIDVLVDFQTSERSTLDNNNDEIVNTVKAIILHF